VELFSEIIKARRESNNAGSDGTDILSIFMDVKYKNGTKITDEEITGLLIALLFAGQHTSCISSTWTSLYIANNPKVLKKVMAEQEKIFSGKSSQADPLEFDDVNSMEYLHNCMREALRLCPPLILLMRRVKKDIKMKIDGKAYNIPKGDTVMVSPHVGMRLEEVFKDAAAFEPERYEVGREEHKIPYAYLGFGGGMHSCMGQNFGFLQVKTILSVLFREYNLTLLGEEFPQPDFEAMVVGPKGDCRVRYEKK